MKKQRESLSRSRLSLTLLLSPPAFARTARVGAMQPGEDMELAPLTAQRRDSIASGTSVSVRSILSHDPTFSAPSSLSPAARATDGACDSPPASPSILIPITTTTTTAHATDSGADTTTTHASSHASSTTTAPTSSLPPAVASASSSSPRTQRARAAGGSVRFVDEQPRPADSASPAGRERSNTTVGQSLYRELGLDPSASVDDVRRAHKKLVIKYHPDKTNGDAAAELRFRRITRAYKVLTDPNKRQIYDKYGSDGLNLYEEMQGQRKGPQNYLNRHPAARCLYYVFGALTFGYACCCCCWCCHCCNGHCTKPMSKIFGQNFVNMYFEAEKEAQMREYLSEEIEKEKRTGETSI